MIKDGINIFYIQTMLITFSDLVNNEKFITKALEINKEIIQYINPIFLKNKYIKYKTKYLNLKNTINANKKNKI
jgi:hypothetical protein